MATDGPSHPELRDVQRRLQRIYEGISNFQLPPVLYPILDSSLEAQTAEANDEGNHWSQQDHIPGLKMLKESLKIDLDGLQKFLDDPNSAHLPPLSTNAPYLISVWNEVLCAPRSVSYIFKTYLFDPASANTSSQRKQGAHRPRGAKVDVVADNRRLWIRINTIKNSRIIAEFREIDSYLTESDSDSDWNERPSLAQKEFDNSILKMGRGLLQAAKANPVEVTGEIPRVLLRLTRLDTTAINDPRIDQTLKMLTEMGIQVELGERIEEELPLVFPLPQRPQPLPHLLPSFRVNLDLSALIALISDLTHAALPRSMDEAKRRFIPPKEYLDWKEKRRQRANHANQADGVGGQGGESIAAVEHLPHDLATHSRALRNQLLQEMSKSMIHELRDRFSSIPGYGRVDLNGSLPPVEFWTTTEARDRCLRIVSKIGGVNEKRRAYSLFCLNPSSPRQPIPVPEAEKCFWEGSRFEHGSLPLFPLHFHSSDIMKGSPLLDQREKRRSFMKGLAQTCKDILDQENTKSGNGRNDFISQATAFPTSVDAASNQCSTTPNIDYLASEPGRGLDSQSASSHKPGIHRKEDQDCEIPRATVMKANAKLTAHTVESLLWGAELGWTTLTANRTSVKAILKEMKAARFSGRLEVEDDDAIEEELQDGQRDTEVAAIWIVDPRSLAEQMSGGGSM